MQEWSADINYGPIDFDPSELHGSRQVNDVTH